jgi:hypothetical protein
MCKLVFNTIILELLSHQTTHLSQPKFRQQIARHQLAIEYIRHGFSEVKYSC